MRLDLDLVTLGVGQLTGEKEVDRDAFIRPGGGDGVVEGGVVLDRLLDYAGGGEEIGGRGKQLNGRPAREGKRPLGQFHASRDGEEDHVGGI